MAFQIKFCWKNLFPYTLNLPIKYFKRKKLKIIEKNFVNMHASPLYTGSNLIKILGAELSQINRVRRLNKRLKVL
jgi:hypothetical protein